MLSEATAGHPKRSPRFRELLSPVGVGPEPRSEFVADSTAWGALILACWADRPEFDDADVELLSHASELFARALRPGLVSEACRSGDDASFIDAPRPRGPKMVTT